MSLYLQTAIGGGRYLLDADHVLEIAETRPDIDEIGGWEDQGIVVVDMRELFQATDGSAGAYVLVGQTSGDTAALRVDRVENLLDVSDSEFRPLPPIGPAGLLIDALCARLVDERPILRLRGERALAAIRTNRGSTAPAIRQGG